jgi:hypothetical protein
MSMTPARWWTLAAVVLMIAGGIWLSNAIEWVDIDVPTFAKNEAARDRLYAAKSLVRRLGGHVASPRSLDKLPPVTAILFLSSAHWNMFPGRDAALRHWVEGGGRLVFAEVPFFREQFVPAWAPLRNVADVTPPPAASASEPASAPTSIAELMRVRPDRCRVLSEPAAVQPAFGAARSFRVCGSAYTRLSSPVGAQWSVGDPTGTRMSRVAVGQGSVAASTMRGAFANNNIVNADGALAFVAALDLRAGDEVWFVDEEARTPFLRALWSSALPALLLGLAALALLLWRGGPRFGPLAVEPGAARRSIGEQIRRTAAFIAAGRGEALHRASLRALEAAAGRVIPDFASLPALADRAQAIASRCGSDPVALASAMQMPKRHRALAGAIAELERARRALLPAARAARSTHALPPDS